MAIFPTPSKITLSLFEVGNKPDFVHAEKRKGIGMVFMAYKVRIHEVCIEVMGGISTDLLHYHELLL